jgi:pimeloyl-ACP methyl ester carboxylesterase
MRSQVVYGRGLMRRIVIFSCALAALALALDVAHAQPAGEGAADPDKQPFSGPELLAGKKMTEAECGKIPTAVWVSVQGESACIRYYLSTIGGEGKEPIVGLSEDMVFTNGRREARPYDHYLKSTPASLQNGSNGWSRRLGAPYLLLARPGTYGSSGEHAKRRTPQEIALMSAALDAIKARHNYMRFHLVGHDEGGHTAAALLSQRNDLGCVVLSSALVSVRFWMAENAWQDDLTKNKNPLDPYALIGQIGKRPELRIFVLTDPDDTVMSARLQTHYAKKLAAAGLPVRQIFAAASDAAAHALWREGRDVVAACAKGSTTDSIVARFENKKPQTPPDADEPRLQKANMGDVSVSEAQCAAYSGQSTAVWVRAEGRGFCVRYWISTAGGKKDDALLYVHGDVGSYKGNRLELDPYAALATSADKQRQVHRWSRIYKGPYVYLTRMGAFGSSGDHSKRKSRLEVQVAMAAVDAIKERHGLKRFHPIGQSGGGHTVAALAQMRSDFGCVVMTSGAMSSKTNIRDHGGRITPNVRALYDPIDHVGAMQHQAGRRMVVLSDPDDRYVSYRSQREFVDRVKTKGLPILHITAAAGDKDFHGLSGLGRQLAIDCAADMDDDAMVKKYQNKAAPAAKR